LTRAADRHTCDKADRRRFLPAQPRGGPDGHAIRQDSQPPDGDRRQLPSKCTLEFREGDVFRHLLAGAGGWDDPLACAPELAVKDVLEEKLIAGHARRECGVAIDLAARKVLAEETARFRAQLGAREASASPARPALSSPFEWREP